MSRYILFLLFIPIILSAEAPEELSLPTIVDQGDNEKGPFTLSALAYWSGNAEFSDSDVKGQDLQYTEIDSQARLVWCYEPCIEEGSHVFVGYNQVNLCWEENPFFCDHNFYTVNLGIGYFTKRLCDWWWLGQVKANVDVEHADIDHYLFWDLILWGRYTWSDCIGVHIGFYALTGMKIDRVYPIIGFDWKFWDKWQLNLVYPTNISLLYQLSENWKLGAAARFLEARRRVGKDNALPRGLFEYRSGGVEAIALYECDPPIQASVFAGVNLGGKLKIADRHWKNASRFRFDSTVYAGSEFSWNF